MDTQESRIYAAIIISSIIIGFIIVYFIISIIRHQRKNIELHKLNVLAEITQLEKERSRIASDLHDELGPLLSAVKMKINSFELSDEEDIIQIEKTNNHIDQVIKRIREISFGLMPSSLIRKGIITAIKEFVDNLNVESRIKFTFEFDNQIIFNEHKSINIYRIIQELVHNTIKHSNATEVHISFNMINNKAELIFHDNGEGFEYDKETLDKRGFGLRSLLSRTEIIDGKMYLDSGRGHGTTYTFEIPV